MYVCVQYNIIIYIYMCVCVCVCVSRQYQISLGTIWILGHLDYLEPASPRSPGLFQWHPLIRNSPRTQAEARLQDPLKIHGQMRPDRFQVGVMIGYKCLKACVSSHQPTMKEIQENPTKTTSSRLELHCVVLSFLLAHLMWQPPNRFHLCHGL